MFNLLPPMAWAKQQFGDANLGDLRLERRLVHVASSLAAKPCGTLPPAMSTYAEMKAAYRLLNHPGVSRAAVQEPHCRGVQQLVTLPGEYLLIEDTTSLDFSTLGHTDGLGRIGDDGGRGLFVHTTLAVRMAHRPELIGIYAQQVWARGDDFRCEGRPKRERLSRDRESQRWAAHLEPAVPGARTLFVADRESDIYECLRRLDEGGHGFVIRACQSRALVGEQRLLFDQISQQPRLGHSEVDLRARPGQPARAAKLEVRTMRVTIRAPWRPQGSGEHLELGVVEARESGGPLRWVLLTSEPVTELARALRVLKIYEHRWLIEEYHKALKTGCGIEQSQLESRQALEALLGVLAVVAARLLAMKLLARSGPDEPAPGDLLGPNGPKVLALYSFTGPWTWRAVFRKIAELGGFHGQSKHKDPGWITLWRGFEKLWPSLTIADALLDN
jgi:hypothetical protein